MRKAFAILSMSLLVLPLLSTTGCSKSDDGMSSQQQEKANRLDTIARQSGGDWEKVSQADRDYLVKELSSGNEASAKMLLLAKAGKLTMAPGGGPKPGGPPPNGTSR